MNLYLKYLEAHKAEILTDLQDLVGHQSPTQNKEAVDACGAFLVNLFSERLCATPPERFKQTEVGDCLLFKIGQGGKRTLILAHFDTVWDIDRLGSRIEDGKFYGPGAFDMKGGLIQAIWALKALQETKGLANHEVCFFCTSDEEIGSPCSRPLIEKIAKQCDQALIPEPAEENTGNLKIGRKGVGLFQVTIEGKAAHAGNNPLGGISAAEEMAHQILRLNALQDMSRGTSVNVGVAQAGNRVNVIPERALISVDVRVTSIQEAERIEERVRACTPVLASAKITVSGEFNRPPMEVNERNKKLYEQAHRAAREIGFEVSSCVVGGGSDGNFTSALGIPTLDGLGSEGGGPHATYEHIVIDGLPRRAALISQIIAPNY